MSCPRRPVTMVRVRRPRRPGPSRARGAPRGGRGRSRPSWRARPRCRAPTRPDASERLHREGARGGPLVLDGSPSAASAASGATSGGAGGGGAGGGVRRRPVRDRPVRDRRRRQAAGPHPRHAGQAGERPARRRGGPPDRRRAHPSRLPRGPRPRGTAPCGPLRRGGSPARPRSRSRRVARARRRARVDGAGRRAARGTQGRERALPRRARARPRPRRVPQETTQAFAPIRLGQGGQPGGRGGADGGLLPLEALLDRLAQGRPGLLARDLRQGRERLGRAQRRVAVRVLREELGRPFGVERRHALRGPSTDAPDGPLHREAREHLHRLRGAPGGERLRRPFDDLPVGVAERVHEEGLGRRAALGL